MKTIDLATAWAALLLSSGAICACSAANPSASAGEPVPGSIHVDSDVIETAVLYRAPDDTWQTKTEIYSAAQYAELARERAAAREGNGPRPLTSVVSCSNASALWLYDTTQTLRLCLIGSGSYAVPSNSPVYHNLGGFWPGQDSGELWNYSGECGFDYPFNAWGPRTYIGPPIPFDKLKFDLVELDTYSCWTP
jgi:hypothetical protein